MTRIEKSIIIDKPVNEVFRYASDWGKWSDWFEGVSDFKPVTEIKKGNGARYAYKAKMMDLCILLIPILIMNPANNRLQSVDRMHLPLKKKSLIYLDAVLN